MTRSGLCVSVVAVLAACSSLAGIDDVTYEPRADPSDARDTSYPQSPADGGETDVGTADSAVDGTAPDSALEPSYMSAVLADTPLGYWRLGETTGVTAANEVAQGVAGSYQTPGCTLGAPGAIAHDPNTAVAFDGLNGKVTIGAALDFPATQAFSIEAWVKPAMGDSGPRYQHIFTEESQVSGKKQGYALFVLQGDVTFERFGV